MGKLRCLLLMIICQVMFSLIGMAENMPHTFVSGGTASALQVNENFSYLLNKVGMKKVYADGEYIGETGVPLYGLYRPSSMIGVRLSTGYDFNLKKDGTIYSSVIFYYKNNDCAGAPYHKQGSEDYFYFQPSRGEVAIDSGQVFFVKKNATLYNTTMDSKKITSNGNCYNASETGIFSLIQSNAPSETGISTYPFPTPITIEGYTATTVIDD